MTPDDALVDGGADSDDEAASSDVDQQVRDGVQRDDETTDAGGTCQLCLLVPRSRMALVPCGCMCLNYVMLRV